MAKSAFDKLFEEAMSDDFGAGSEASAGGFGDEAALGIDTESEGDEEGTVTFTLDKETAKKLVEVLQGALGGSEESLESEEEESAEHDLGGSEDGSEDEEEVKFEAPQAKYEDFGVEPKSKELQGKGKQKVDSVNYKVVAGKAETPSTPSTGRYMPLSKTVKNDIKADSKITGSQGKDTSAFSV